MNNVYSLSIGYKQDKEFKIVAIGNIDTSNIAILEANYTWAWNLEERHYGKTNGLLIKKYKEMLQKQ